jgi:hypothetical protein
MASSGLDKSTESENTLLFRTCPPYRPRHRVAAHQLLSFKNVSWRLAVELVFAVAPAKEGRVDVCSWR